MIITTNDTKFLISANTTTALSHIKEPCFVLTQNKNLNLIGNPIKTLKIKLHKEGCVTLVSLLGSPTQSHQPATPLLAQRFHLPPLSKLHSSWDHLLNFFYCVELNWRSNRSHECYYQLRGEKVKKEQDLSLSAIANLGESTESTPLHLQVHKESRVQFSGLYPMLLHIWVRPRSCPFSSSGSETANMACLFDPR